MCALCARVSCARDVVLHFRFDNPLLADQRMMLQASLLQYPHLGIFPNAALYPGLPGTGVRYPNDYYGQNLSGMPLSSKYPDVGGTAWLGFDRYFMVLQKIIISVLSSDVARIPG